MVEILVPMSFFAMITAIAVGRPIAKAYARRLDSGHPVAGPAPSTDVAWRMERLETQVESLSAALDRSMEEQRFLTRLLAERVPAGDAAGAPAYTSPRAG